MTRIEQAELSLDEAVAEAQALGFAEADPSADLDGHDAAAKLSILAYRAFGAWVRPDGFPVRGIREIDPADCDLAESMGCRIRLIARAARVDGALDMAVEPLLLPDVAPARVGRGGIQRGLPALRVVRRPEPVRQGRRRAADRDRGARRSDRSRAGQLGALAGAAGAAAGRAPARRCAPAPRRHYLRVTGEPHPGLERRIESLVRRAGLTVQNRATPRRGRARAPRLHDLAELGRARSPRCATAVARLARVEQCLCLGVLE